MVKEKNSRSFWAKPNKQVTGRQQKKMYLLRPLLPDGLIANPRHFAFDKKEDFVNTKTLLPGIFSFFSSKTESGVSDCA